MSGAVILLAGLAALPGPGAEITCTFTQACIDRRPCFDSPARAKIEVLGDGIAVLALDGETRRPARLERNGVWKTVVTAPDRDHGNRTHVLDWTEDGRATLVVSSPGTAVEMLSRTGTCQITEDRQ